VIHKFLVVLVLVVAVCTTACGGVVVSYPTRGVDGSAECPAGTYLSDDGSTHAIPVCRKGG